MKKIAYILVLLFTLGIQQVWASVLQTSTTLPQQGIPEHLYTVKNSNGYYMSAHTSPTQTASNYGLFAFYKVDDKEHCYYIYSFNAKQWLTYEVKASYQNGVGFVKLSNQLNKESYFSIQTVPNDIYEIAPVTKQGKAADKYFNWFKGVGQDNPLDGNVTVGLWQDPANKDKGSAWTLTESTKKTYTIQLDEKIKSISIAGKNYQQGEKYTAAGTLQHKDIVIPKIQGYFAAVSINDVAHQITVRYIKNVATLTTETYKQAFVYPMQQNNVGEAKLNKNADTYTLSNKVLAVSYVHQAKQLYFAGSTAMHLLPGTELFTLVAEPGIQIPASAMQLTKVETVNLKGDAKAVGGAEHFDGKALVAHYQCMYNGATIQVVWRAVLRDGSHYLRTETEITTNKNVGMNKVIPMLYNVDTEQGKHKVKCIGNTRGAILISNKIFAGLEHPTAYNTVEPVQQPNSNIVTMQGLWSRNTILHEGKTWKISAVVGLIAQDGKQNAVQIRKTQKRRSFLAYSERERAVPWHANPVYISWYELNIDRNNATDPTQNMNANQVLDVIKQWKENLYNRYHVAPNSFVIDDGWDNYGTWTFHAGFPNQMRDIANKANEMNAGVGAWLGPVGGYGQSGNYRRNYWNDKGKMVLSNPAYYKVFLEAATNLTKHNGNFNFFKFDGISAQFSAVGPDEGDKGNENAEGIIELERYIRENLRRNIFFNTTVGTWASPFWYHYTDATWRQEGDYGTAGNNHIDRENWITYRDRLVYQNYVQRSPLCPINTLMTHGFILSKFGQVSKNMDYEACRRELRCAFACGSGMVELYNDYQLMNNIADGKLWSDLAECIAWQKRNADVLPDIHWVGGNPWNGSKTSVYGWAAWNNKKAVLTLRNGSNNTDTYKFTLLEALNIPAHIKGSIILRKAFNQQDELQGINENQPIDIDTKIEVQLKGSSVYSFEGINANEKDIKVTHITLTAEKKHCTVMVGNTFVVCAHMLPNNASYPLCTWTTSDATIATVYNGCIKALRKGKVKITATAQDKSGVKGEITLTIVDNEEDIKKAETAITPAYANKRETHRYYNLSGQQLNNIPKHGFFIKKGTKTVKVVK